MANRELVESKRKLDTLALVGAASDEVAGQMLLLAFTEAYLEVINGMDEDRHVKGTGTIPEITIIVSTTVEKKRTK